MAQESLNKIIERFKERAGARAAAGPLAEPLRPERPEPAVNGQPAGFQEQPEDAPTQLVMPYWSESIRALPNEMLRSALFTVRNPQTRRDYLKEREIASYERKVFITYTGEELRQSPDGDVFLQLIHLAQNQPPDTWLEFKRADMLRALGWRPEKDSYDRLLDTCIRLNATSVRIHCPRVNDLAPMLPEETTETLSKGIAFSLISKFVYEGDGGKPARKWAVKLDPELVALFSHSQFTLLSWDVRRQLKYFGKWLHGYLSTHRAPLPFTVEMCMRNSGSDANTASDKGRKNWAQNVLLPALEELKGLGFLDDYQYDRSQERVSVKRSPLFNT